METIKSSNYVFQTDSDIVNKAYQELNNYMIEYNEDGDKELCVIYFSSNDIYYPNTEEIFRKKILEKNFFEWYHTRITKAYKHIFIRDIFKQWYLAGINKNINSPEELTDFLKRETNGYKVITIGSSAGGYAAIYYGSYLNTQYALTFNPQFELESLMRRSSECKNPILFRYRDEKSIYFDITKCIHRNKKVYYFYSQFSNWDNEENTYIGNSFINLYKIGFKTKHHGIPFLKVALHKVINMQPTEIEQLSKNNHSSILFTIRMVGVSKTIKGFYLQLKMRYMGR